MISTPAAVRVLRAAPQLHSHLAPVLPLRGCVLCQHGTGPAEHRWCTHPQAPHQPVDQVRAPGGACGPEAKLLHFPGLQP